MHKNNIDNSSGRNLYLAFIVMGVIMILCSQTIRAQTTAKTEPDVIYQSQTLADGTDEKKNYYFKKIQDNEINFLKSQIEEQKAEYKKDLEKQKNKYEQLLKQQKIAHKKTLQESSYPLVEELEGKLKQAEKDLQEQQKTFEQALVQKEREHGMEIKSLTEHYEKLPAADQGKKEEPTTERESKQIKELQTKINSLKEQIKIQKNVHQEVLGLKEKEYDDRISELLSGSKGASEAEREQEVGNMTQGILQRDNKIKVLSQRLEDLGEKIEKQRSVYERALLEKDREHRQKEEELKELYKDSNSEEVAAFEEKLNDKYKQLDRIVREKEKMHAEELLEKDKEIQKIKSEALEKEQVLRQMIADKELEFGQKVEQEKQKYEKENQTLKKSSEQLRMYLLKLKEDLKTKSVIITEKDSQISVLNKKLALYSHEESEQGKEMSEVIRQDLKNTKNENKRLRQQIKKLEDQIAEQKSVFETRLAKQKKAQDDLKKETEAEIIHNSFEWEKKTRILEAKYIKQIRELEKENLDLQDDYERRMEKVSEKLRDKIEEDEKIRDRLTNVRKNQVAMLEEMLTSKATMLKKVLPEFKKDQEERAQVYFERAMNAILKKDYARAKYELEEVLLIDPENKMTINILGSINFLLEKKQ